MRIMFKVMNYFVKKNIHFSVLQIILSAFLPLCASNSDGNITTVYRANIVISDSNNTFLSGPNDEKATTQKLASKANIIIPNKSIETHKRYSKEEISGRTITLQPRLTVIENGPIQVLSLGEIGSIRNFTTKTVIPNNITAGHKVDEASDGDVKKKITKELTVTSQGAVKGNFVPKATTGIVIDDSLVPERRKAVHDAAHRFTTRPTTTKEIRKRTAAPRETFEEQCDYIANYCLKTYQTGRVCGRTMYHAYITFKNVCMLEFVNCMERYELWQIAHMGQCYELKSLTEYIHYGYSDDGFMDKDYVVDDQQWGLSYMLVFCERRQRGQNIAAEDIAKFKPPRNAAVGPQTEGAGAAADRLSTWATKTTKVKTRSTPSGITLDNHCEYLLQPCLHAHQTGALCARTIYFVYHGFEDYCKVEFVNCMEGYELWQIVYMGNCFNVTHVKEYIIYPYDDDWFLDQYYVLNDHR